VKPSDFASDFSDIRGQDAAVLDVARSVIAGVGVHLVGPPGVGKIMIARRVPSLLPPLDDHARAWLSAEYLGIGMPVRPTERPFRAPHHTVSSAALVGSSWIARDLDVCRCRGRVAHQFHDLPRLPVPRAGELQLARFGVLLLDEVHDFALATLDALCEARYRMHCAPLIIATSIPCPCGWLGSDVRRCECSALARERFDHRVRAALARLPGLDTVPVISQSIADARALPPGRTSAELREAVLAEAPRG